MSVGDEAVDHQHREILSLIAQMTDCAKHPGRREEAFPVLVSLLSCLDEHFAEEERQMNETGYPEADEHRRDHDAMDRTLRTLRASVRSPAELIRSTITILPRWVARHQATLDRNLCRHAALRMGTAPGFRVENRL
ncbi:hemerythrin family protein [Azospirillum sp. C340-1]|uniref:Hemerythrin family protein n=2 Tax=Azospirillum isscasi TaxID=3053926 RepID=A0ABU0WPE7_9PROT|nr:hemerythrin family protein [Azospirillum isscasi]